MTLRGIEDKHAALKAQQELSTQERSAATSHFHKKQEQEEANKASAKADVMPLAIQKFTLAHREETEKRRAEIEALKSSGNAQMPAAQSYFTKKAQEEKATATQDAENERLKENPVLTAAGAHFAKIEEQKKAELEELKESPVITHAAGAHFAKIAQEEKERKAEAAKQREGGEKPNLIATDYFARKENEEKMARMESIRIAREAAKQKSVEPLPADYFAKQNEARLEAEKQAVLDGLKDAPIAVRSKSKVLYTQWFDWFIACC